jgi:hypothetical protein
MEIPAPSVTEAYRRALGDPFDKVAQVACFALTSRGGVQNAEALIRALGHVSWRVRLEACKALIILGKAGQRVVATLQAMSREPEASVYDTECDEFERIDQEISLELGEPLPWPACWGKLHTILEKARNLAASGDMTAGASANGGATAPVDNSKATEGPPSARSPLNPSARDGDK